MRKRKTIKEKVKFKMEPFCTISTITTRFEFELIKLMPKHMSRLVIRSINPNVTK